MKPESFWTRLATAASRIAGHAKDAWEDIRDETSEAVREAREDVERKTAERDPARQLRIKELLDWYRSQARPALILEPDKKAALDSAAARLGGPAWLADGEQWPTGPDGERLEFVAQLNFGALPALPGFPSSGMLRFFVGRDDLFRMNLDDPAKGSIRLLWNEGAPAGGRLEPAIDLTFDDGSPFTDENVRERGLALAPTLASDTPDYYSWQVTAHLEAQPDSPDDRAAEDALSELTEERAFAHRVGGHPSFTQYDIRKPGHLDDYDVVLLALTSDDAIMWGDVGEAVFLIRQADLDRRDFSNVLFSWDCH